MSFARNFAIGQQIASNAIRTYREADELQAKEKAGQVYKDAAEQKTQTESNFGEVDANAVYQGEGSDGAMTNAEAASFGLYTPKEDKEAGTGTTRKFALGSNPSALQDKEFTPNQRRAAGLRAQMDFYDSRGDVDNSAKARTQIEAADNAEYQAGQRKRLTDEQLRADTLRDGLAGVDTTTSETRTLSDVYRDVGEKYKAAGDFKSYREYVDTADKRDFAAAGKKFTSWAQSITKETPLGQAAADLAKLFNKDGTPGSVKGVIPQADGSVVIGLQGGSGEPVTPIRVTSIEQLLSAGRAHYTPESFAKIQEKKWEIENDPSKRYLKFNANQTVVDTTTGKVVQKGIKAGGGTPVYDEDGNITGYTGGGGGGGGGEGKGKKPKDPIAATTDAVMDVVKNSSDAKSLTAADLMEVSASARELVANAQRQGRQIDPYVAGAVLLGAKANPESVKEIFNPATGRVERTVRRGDDVFTIGNTDESLLQQSNPTKWKAIAGQFTERIPKSDRDIYIKAAGGDANALKQLQGSIAAGLDENWARSFKAQNGRAPTQEDRAAILQRGAMSLNSQLEMVKASGAVEQAQKQAKMTAQEKKVAEAKAAIGTPDQIMALPPGKAAEIYQKYGGQTDGFQREALQQKMQQDRRANMNVGGLRLQ
jgi:hypothetical protein